MRAFILSLLAVCGDAAPWTVAQVAAGEPARNALLEGRLHNIGVITNAAEAGVTTVGGVAVPATYSAQLPHLYYGKREAEPYTLAQVAAGQTNGGLLTFVDSGHGTGHRPILAAPAPAVYAYSHYPYVYGKREANPASGAMYGKREAEPEAAADPQLITYANGAVVPVDPANLAATSAHLAAKGYYHPWVYGKRSAEAAAAPYTLAQVAAGQTAGGIITSVGGQPVVPHLAPRAGVHAPYYAYWG